LNFFRFTIFILIIGVCLSGCISTGLYTWGSYQDVVYSHLKGESAYSQIEKLEKDREIIASRSLPAPPGFYAHLGMLYSETGSHDKAIECFILEKTLFPESAPFMDRLLSAYGVKNDTK